MATLIRSKNASPSPPSTLLYSTVPTPFPREQLDEVSISNSGQDDTAEVAKGNSVEHDNPFENGVTSVESGIETPNTLTLVNRMTLVFFSLRLTINIRKKSCHLSFMCKKRVS
jgi:hypothetical protein